jgi:glucosyl-dolichyl phosphate glucuronosyltransferase
VLILKSSTNPIDVAAFSIIVPTFNRAVTLQATLNSIEAQSTLQDVEVIVVDNGSTDGTKETALTYVSSNPRRYKYLFDDEPGLLTGRHAGASMSTGDILCFLDDDVQLDKNYIEGIKDAFSDTRIQLATGPSIPNFETVPPQWLDQFWINNEYGSFCTWLSLMDFGNRKKIIHPNYVWGLNFCIRKEAFRTLGGFHPDCITNQLALYQGDGETGLTMKAAAKDYTALYHPLLKVYHFVSKERLKEDYFLKRAYFQGICNSFTDLRRKELEETNFQVPRNIKAIIYSKWDAMKKIFLTPADVKRLKKRLKRAELSGYELHQQAFYSNSAIKEWVLRKDYFDYKLPL